MTPADRPHTNPTEEKAKVSRSGGKDSRPVSRPEKARGGQPSARSGGKTRSGQSAAVRGRGKSSFHKNTDRKTAGPDMEISPEILRAALSVLTAPDMPEAPVQELSVCCAAAKKKNAMLEITAAFSDRSLLERYFDADSPKVRKNAARLAGALGSKRDSEALAALLQRETVLMVVPSVILALGRTGGPAAKQALTAYSVPAPKDETEEGHIRAISAALKKALPAEISADDFPPYTNPDRPVTVLLTAAESFEGVLAEELASLGYTAETAKNSCLVKTTNVTGLFRAHCFQELLFPVGENIPLTPSAVAAAFSGQKLPYRIELRNYSGNRTDFIQRLSEAVGGINTPSDYMEELRVECRGKTATLFRKPCHIPDKRFFWRKQAVSASIAPATAACVIRFARKYFPAQDRVPVVLDPCAGSGTLLFEREAFGPCRHLLGIDVSADAVAAARKNAAAGHSHAKFIQKDCLKFVPSEAVDELYANLPFGNRVGSHSENVTLYKGLVSLLPSWLSDSGFALLYTADFKLLRSCLEKEPGLVTVTETFTEAGGLLPHLFLVARAK